MDLSTECLMESTLAYDLRWNCEELGREGKRGGTLFKKNYF
jgi:hypothetical protein